MLVIYSMTFLDNEMASKGVGCMSYLDFVCGCILRSVTDVDAFQSGRFAKQNGRPETHKISALTLLV